jgi:glucose-6-phosphate isomerase
MFRGESINDSEGRAVMHWALRAAPAPPEDAEVLGRMEAFCAEAAHFRHIVHIGIGGSHLGPEMACRALAHLARPGVSVDFVSNVDGANLAEVLARTVPEETLFIVASKTFTTEETLANARSARRFVADRLGEGAIARHFAALSTNEAAVREFGIQPSRMFGFWDWVGGRYSLWSCIGLPVALLVGMENFRRLLAGARAMDEHFRTALPFENLPVILGLLGVWNRSFMGFPARAVLPYDHRLSRLPAYLQQLDMESNGKGVDRAGRPVEAPTGPIVFGAPGTDSQHSFLQLLHQGTEVIPAEFILALAGDDPYPEHHRKLAANCIAQAEALAMGRGFAEVKAALGDTVPDALAAQRSFPGNRPSTTLLIERLDPERLGALIALYEHRVFVEGCVWGINSFDQWGVELGKNLAKTVEAELEGGPPAPHDSSTGGLIRKLKEGRL